jgi:FkbM family methyltransferase
MRVAYTVPTRTQLPTATGPRTVEVRRLDTLFAAGEIPPAYHIKIDCEGFEPVNRR